MIIDKYDLSNVIFSQSIILWQLTFLKCIMKANVPPITSALRTMFKMRPNLSC